MACDGDRAPGGGGRVDAGARLDGSVAGPLLAVGGSRPGMNTMPTVASTALTVLATAPRAGLIGGDGTPRWLQRFDDSAGFALGARRDLTLAPWKRRALASTRVVDDTGYAQLVTAP